jgi:dynein heavy chain
MPDMPHCMQSFKNPPAAVKLVMEAVCVLLDAKPNMVADPNMPGERAENLHDCMHACMYDLPTYNLSAHKRPTK